MKKMKKTFLLMLLLVPILGWSQNYFWFESFDSVPEGWTIENNWSIEESKLSLSLMPGMPAFDMSAISPVLTLHPHSDMLLVIQYIELFYAVDETAEISVIHAAGEDILWHWDLCGGCWGGWNGSECPMDLSGYSGQNVQLRFRCFGSAVNDMISWKIFDIGMTAIFDNDLTAVEVAGPNNVPCLQPVTSIVRILNSGTLWQSDYIVRLYINDEEIGSCLVTEPLEPYCMAEITFDWTPWETGDHILTGKVSGQIDECPGNDNTQPFNLHVFDSQVLQVLIWDWDRHSYYTNPDGGNQDMDCETALENALYANGYAFTTVEMLPEYLHNYDIIVATLGIYCVG